MPRGFNAPGAYFKGKDRAALDREIMRFHERVRRGLMRHYYGEGVLWTHGHNEED